MSLREINLIPDEMLFRDNLFRHLIIWTTAIVFLILMVFGFNIYMSKKISGGFNYTTGIKGIDNQLSVKINTILALQEEITALDQQMGYAGNILRSESCARIISGFVKNMNRKTWLERLEISQEKGSYSIGMNGYSVDSESLGDFIERLSNERMFESVLLKYMRDAGSDGTVFKGGSSLVRFQIEFRTRR